METIMAFANRTDRQTTSAARFIRHGESRENRLMQRDQFDEATETTDAHNESHKAHRRDRRMRKLAYKRDRYS